MKLNEYISWANSLNEYQDSATLADSEAWGFEVLPGNYSTPKIDLKNVQTGDEGYDSVRNDLITNWAKVKWPFLECIDAKVQIQRPGEKCKPHLDFLGYYLENVCRKYPKLLRIDHTLQKPGIDVWRMFVAVDDHVTGQIFNVNNEEWKWTRGECMRLNNWQALHWTENKSTVDRVIIKITGVKFLTN
tara:strand:+ start:344 stop:907 length:564 start_codon:yes stop_codon:yes gene_type:complete